ncbi:T3SS (YopN, CesT) and YbjN peptide-binding chaperone 1 [Rhodococcus sp. 2H158]
MSELDWDSPIATGNDDALRAAVLRVFSAVLAEEIEPDTDGDVPIWVDDVLTYAVVDSRAGVVELTTYLVERIAGRTRAAEVLVDLQAQWPDARLELHQDRVTAVQRVPARPLVPVHLARAVAVVAALVPHVPELAARLGGRACVFDEPGDEAAGEVVDLLGGCGCDGCGCR